MAAYDITALSSALEFDTSDMTGVGIAKLSSTRFVMAWQRSSTVKYVQVFEIDLTTGVITALSSPLNFYSTSSANTSRIGIHVYDATHFVLVWNGGSQYGYTRSFQVNAGTGAVTTWGSENNYSGSNSAFSPDIVTLDSTHFLVTRAEASGYSRVFELNSGTGAVTALGSDVQFAGAQAYGNSVVRLSSTMGLVTYSKADDFTFDGMARAIGINTSTWATSALVSEYEWMDDNVAGTALVALSATRALVFVYRSTGTKGMYLYTLGIDGSGNISNVGSAVQVSTAEPVQEVSGGNIVIIDNDGTTAHVIVFYTGADNDGFARTYEVTLSTGAITAISTIEYETSDNERNHAIEMATGLFVNMWMGVSTDGFVRAFRVEIPSVGPSQNSNFLVFMQ